MTARQRRATRGLAAASIAVVLAALSHTVGGGAAPGPVLVLAAIALAWPVSTLLVGRRTHLIGQFAAVGAAQIALHALFAIAGETGGATASHAHDGHTATELLAAPLAAQVSLSLPMLAAHIVAALVALVLLRHGEAAVAIVSEWVAATVAAFVATSSPQPASVRSVVAVRAVPHDAPPAGPASRRGPPVTSR